MEGGGKAESANLFLKGSSLSFSITETYKKKSLDRNGNSVFTDEQKEVELSFFHLQPETRKWAGMPACCVRRNVEDFPSPQKPEACHQEIRGIVIRAGTMLYPDVSVMLAGTAPLG